MKLAVYGWAGFPLRTGKQYRCIAAVRSKKELAQLANLSLYYINGWTAKTANPKELEIALAKPGVIFYRALNDYTGDYQEAPKPEGL